MRLGGSRLVDHASIEQKGEHGKRNNGMYSHCPIAGSNGMKGPVTSLQVNQATSTPLLLLTCPRVVGGGLLLHIARLLGHSSELLLHVWVSGRSGV